MPDEIDLLRAFRADTPGPDDAACERARAAVALADGAAAPDPRSHPRRPRGILRFRGNQGARGRVILAAAVVIVVGVVGGVLATVLPGSPSLNAPVVTAWQPARPLPPGSGGITAPAGTWRLMSYLVAKGWQENTTGPEPGLLTCPTAAACYVEGDNSTSASGPSDMNSLYVSSDGAQNWSVLPVPDGVTFTSALSCASVTDCAAGGLYYGHQPVYLSTANGGHSWTVRPLPSGSGQIVDLTCAAATSCRGLTQTSSEVPFPNYGNVRPGIRFVATTDGGRHFTVTPFPADTAMLTLSCPTSTHCVAYGVHLAPGRNDKTGPDLTRDVLLVTDDDGASWRAGKLPNNVGTDGFPQVTCTDASHCAMLGYVIGSGSQSGSMSVSKSGKITETVPDQYSVVGFSADGGLTWTIRRLPASIPYPSLNALACPTASLCYAAGGDAIPQQIGNTYNGGSSVVAVTRNGGRTWQRVTFAVPAQVPGGMQGDSFLAIGQIQCPRADACVATGVSDQGSTSTPVYTNHG